MQISGSINPFSFSAAQATRAYQVNTPAKAAMPAAATAPLVAASVNKPVAFDGRMPAGPTHVLQMYTRAADKVEAAIAVRLGQSIDLRG